VADRLGLRPADAEELVTDGLRLLLRGGTWQALARELAWSAALATGAAYRVIDWLAPLVEARLAERVDGLEFRVDMAATSARDEHVRRWPHDHAGAETVAVWDGRRVTLEQLGVIYLDELEWAIALLSERIHRERPRRRRRPTPASQASPRSNRELPRRFALEVERSREPFGWAPPPAA